MEEQKLESVLQPPLAEILEAFERGVTQGKKLEG